MKKAVAALFALFFSITFLISLYQYASNYKSAVRSIPSQYRYAIEVSEPEPEIIDAMIAMAQEDEVSIVRQVNYRDESNISVTKDFVYVIGKYEKRLELVSGRMLTQTDAKSAHFVSTESTGSNEQVGELYHFGKSISYYMLPLSALCDQYDIKGVYNISAVDEEKAEDFLNHLLRRLDTEYNLNLDSSKFILRSSTTMNDSSANMFEDVLSIVKIAVYCFLVLIVLFSCIFFTKEISVLKINGYSNIQIVSKVIMNAVGKVTLCSLATSIIIMFLVDGGKFNLFFGAFPKMLLAGVISLTLSTVTYYCYVSITKETQGVKGKSPIRIVSITNLVLYVVLSVICVGVMGTFGSNIVKVEQKTKNISSWQKVQNYGVFFPGSSGLDQSAIHQGEYPLDIPSYEFFKYINLNENGIYAASQPFTEKNAPYNTSILSRIFVVNANYLDLFPIMTTDGVPVTVSQAEEKSIYLVPEKYRNREHEITSILQQDRKSFHDDLHVGLYGYDPKPHTKEIEIIYVTDQQQYFSVNTDVAIDNNNLISDALVLVLTDGNCLVPDINLFGSNPSLYIPLGSLSTTDKQKELLGVLKANSLEDNFPYFVQSNTLVFQQIDELRSQAYALLAILLIVIAVMLLNIVQTIVSLFRLNEYRCFILMSLGRPKAETLRSILVPIALAQTIIVGASLLLYGGKNGLSLVIVQTFEICFAIATALFNEKKNILNVLKKGV